MWSSTVASFLILLWISGFFCASLVDERQFIFPTNNEIFKMAENMILKDEPGHTEEVEAFQKKVQDLQSLPQNQMNPELISEHKSLVDSFKYHLAFPDTDSDLGSEEKGILKVATCRVFQSKMEAFKASLEDFKKDVNEAIVAFKDAKKKIKSNFVMPSVIDDAILLLQTDPATFYDCKKAEEAKAALLSSAEFTDFTAMIASKEALFGDEIDFAAEIDGLLSVVTTDSQIKIANDNINLCICRILPAKINEFFQLYNENADETESTCSSELTFYSLDDIPFEYESVIQIRVKPTKKARMEDESSVDSSVESSVESDSETVIVPFTEPLQALESESDSEIVTMKMKSNPSNASNRSPQKQFKHNQHVSFSMSWPMIIAISALVILSVVLGVLYWRRAQKENIKPIE